MLNKFNNLKIVSNPIVNQSLCTLRAKDTDTQGVRLAARKLTRILLYEATKNLPQTEVEVETPLTKFVTKTINPETQKKPIETPNFKNFCSFILILQNKTIAAQSYCVAKNISINL